MGENKITKTKIFNMLECKVGKLTAKIIMIDFRIHLENFGNTKELYNYYNRFCNEL